MDEDVKCRNGHTWNGVIPTIDPSKHYVQNPDIIGKPCDCGRVIVQEGLCGCSREPKEWELKYLQANS